MKSACRVAALCAALAGASSVSRADDAKPVLLAPAPLASTQALPALAPGPPASMDSAAATASALDPDVVILQSAAARDQLIRQNAAATEEAAARRQAYANDWMLRGYTAQLDADGMGTDADRDAAAAQLVPDPSAPPRTAQDSLLNPLADTPTPTPPKPPTPPTPDSSTDASKTEVTINGMPAPLSLPPLLPAIGADAPKGVTRLDAWGSTTTYDPTAVPTNPGLLPPPVHDPALSPDSESSLDVPGLTAERQGIGDPGALDATDPQAEAVIENGTNRAKDDFLLPTVASNDSSEFFKRQSEALAAPNVPPRAEMAIPLARPAPPINTTPKMPPPTGIRSHVDDPFDIIGGPRD